MKTPLENWSLDVSHVGDQSDHLIPAVEDLLEPIVGWPNGPHARPGCSFPCNARVLLLVQSDGADCALIAPGATDNYVRGRRRLPMRRPFAPEMLGSQKEEGVRTMSAATGDATQPVHPPTDR